MPAPTKEECENNKKMAKVKENHLTVSGDCDCPEGEGLVEKVIEYETMPSQTDIKYSCKDYRGKGKLCLSKNIHLNKSDCECLDGTLPNKDNIGAKSNPDYVYACENTRDRGPEPVSDQKNIYRYSSALTFIIFLILLSPLYYYSFKKGGGKTKKRKLI